MAGGMKLLRHNDVETWCKRCTACGRCKATVRGHGELQQSRHGAFNERVSDDLIGPLYRTERANEDIVLMQDHFTKRIEGAAIPTKEAMIVADVIVHEWVYKHGTPLNLHSDRGTEFMCWIMLYKNELLIVCSSDAQKISCPVSAIVRSGAVRKKKKTRPHQSSHRRDALSPCSVSSSVFTHLTICYYSNQCTVTSEFRARTLFRQLA